VDPSITIHQAGFTRPLAYLNEVFRDRRLITVFARRELSARYSQTFLGYAWSVAQPLAWLGIFWLFFGLVFRFTTDPIPYPLFLFSGVTAWFYFSLATQRTGSALNDSGDLIRGIYFPRLILLLSRLVSGAVDLGVSLFILLVMVILWGRFPGVKLVLLPLAVLANALAGLTIGIWVSTVSMRYRDVHHVIPLALQGGIWFTPVFFSVDNVPHSWHWIFYLNPMAGVVALYRWILVGGGVPELSYIWGGLLSLGIITAGFLSFIRAEQDAADRV
jgi:lipopolysaccharide transport system permease protein